MKLLLTLLTIFFTPVLLANTIPVGKSQVITSLKKAVEIAADGDTILLMKGVYREGNIIINKSIKLIGIDEPVLDGENKYEILTVSGEGIVIKGIRFLNSGVSSMNDYASINLIDAEDVIIENNVIENSYFGIHFSNVRYGVIRNNTITGTPKTENTSGNGIHLWKCENILIDNNSVTGHRDGIYFEFVIHSIVRKNISFKNIRYGLHFMFSNNDAYMENVFRDNGAGVAVMYSNHVVMYANIFHHNWGSNAYGLLLKDISDAQILKNEFNENTAGIYMEGTSRMVLRKNNFINNGWALRVQANCSEITVHLNDFIGNTFDVATNGTLAVNKFYNNYWDKYEGYDMDRDGVGDIAFHPVSMYSMVIEHNPNALILLRSFMVSLLEKAEKAIPSITPVNLVDEKPLMKKIL